MQTPLYWIENQVTGALSKSNGSIDHAAVSAVRCTFLKYVYAICMYIINISNITINTCSVVVID